MTTKAGTITELEGLRGVTALWVLIGHWATTIGLSFAPIRQNLWNFEAVDVFIILSGFVIMLLLATRQESYRAYIMRRFFRIAPIYYAVLALSVVLMNCIGNILHAGPDSFMKAMRLENIADTYAHYWPYLELHLVLLHGLIPYSVSYVADFAFVGQAWSLSLEWQFYLLAPVFFYLIQRIDTLRATLVLMLMVAVLMMTGSLFGPAYLGNKLELFALGAVSYTLWDRLSKDPSALPLARYRMAALLVLASLAALHKSFIIGPAVWTIVFYLILAARHKDGILERRACWLLNNPAARFLGRISYSLYLIHFTVMMACLYVLEQFTLSPLAFALWLLAGTVPLSVLVSWGLYVWVEKPGMDLGKHLAQRIRQTA